MHKIIARYVFNEIWPVFLSGMFIFLFIMLAAQMLNISEWIVTYQIKPWKLFIMILYLLPSLMLFALPAVSLMAVLIAFLRLSGDNEMIALKSLGISLRQLLPPVLFISCLAYLASVLLSFYAVPWGARSFREFAFHMTQSKSSLGLKERIFCKPFEGITFYIQQFSEKEKTIQDFFLVDTREKSITYTYIAKEGFFAFRPETKDISLMMKDGTVFIDRKDQEGSKVGRFDTYFITIALGDILGRGSNRKPSAEEMSIRDLIHGISRQSRGSISYNELMIECMGRFSIPLAVLLMGLIGFPLGAQMKSGGRLAGILVSLMIFLCYYLMLAGARSIGEVGIISPKYGLWLPTVFLGSAFLYLYQRAQKERPVLFLEKLLMMKGHS